MKKFRLLVLFRPFYNSYVMITKHTAIDSGHAFEDQLASTFEHIICDKWPLTCELVTKFENIFNLKIVHGYGTFRNNVLLLFLFPLVCRKRGINQWLNEFGFPSIGVPIEPNEMDIHDEFGNSVGEDKRGEIVIRGHNVMKYYMSPPLAKGGRGGSESEYRFQNFRVRMVPQWRRRVL